METILGVILVFGVMSFIGWVLHYLMVDNDPFD